MCLTNEGGVITSVTKSAREAFLAKSRVQITTIIRGAVCEWKHSGEDGRSGGLADQVGGNAIFCRYAICGQPIKVGCFHLAASEAVAVTTVLVGRNKEDIGAFTHFSSPAFATIPYYNKTEGC